MKKRMKFIGMSAAVLLALSPSVTPLLEVGGSSVAYADAGYDAILQNAVKSTYTADRDEWDPNVRTALKDLVNQGAINVLYDHSVAGNNDFYDQVLFPEILKNQQLNAILGSSSVGTAKAQLLVDGKSEITDKDLTGTSFTLTIKIFGTTGKTATANVTINTGLPELAFADDITFDKVLGDDYLDLSDHNASFQLINQGDWSIDDLTDVVITPSENKLIADGIIGGSGRYLKAGEYTQTYTVKYDNAAMGDTITRTLTATIKVSPVAANELKFSNGSEEFKNGATILNKKLVELDGLNSAVEIPENIILNNPDFYNFSTKVTDHGKLDNFLLDYFSKYYKVQEEKIVQSPIAIDKDSLAVDTSKVDMGREGLVLVPFTYTTETGQTLTLTLELNVKNPGKPVFVFNSGQDMTIEVGTPFNLHDFEVYSNLPDYTAGKTDELVDVQIKGSVSSSKVGTYKLTYVATNKFNLVTTLIRTINVVDSGDAPTITDFDSVGYVRYVENYGIRVWGSPNSNGREQYLGHGTAWKIDQKAVLKDGSVWYRVGTNQWVDGQYIDFTPVDPAPITPLNGVGTINYVAGYSINVYSAPAATDTNWTNNQLKHGTKWRVYGEKDGFYNVGGNQWIDAKYVTFVKD